jgi:hypothetical protein
MMIIDENLSNNNQQGVLADALQPLSRTDVSDYSEAIGAVLRAAGFKEDHTRTVLAALAEANGRTGEFRTYSAALGSRLKNNLDPFVEGDQLKERGKADSQRWRRAVERLNKDQDATGFYFVTFTSGGSDRSGHNFPSKMTVDVDTFTNTVRLARHRDDYEIRRKFAFEEAAKSVLQMKTKRTVKRLPPRKMSEQDKLGRIETTLVNSARNLAKIAASQNLDLETLQTLVLDKIRLAFHQEMTGLQFETPQDEAEIDTLSLQEVSDLSDQTGQPPVSLSSRNTGGGRVQALTTLDAFDSVGATTYDVTLRDELSGKASAYESFDSLRLQEQLPALVERTEQGAESLIIRPRGGAFIQLDDCSPELAERLEPVVFMTFETSPNNYQAWIALSEETSETELKAVRSRLLAKLDGTGANGGSFGAMRWPGSVNRKPSRNGFRVRLHRLWPEAYCTVAELEAAGLLAPLAPEPQPLPAKPKGFRLRVGGRAFPSYDRCLAKKDGDRSKADAAFLKLCSLRGFSMVEAVAELERVSERAKEERQRGRRDYANRTWNFVTTH